MPFIDSKITVPVTPEKKENIKSRFGEAVRLLNKSRLILWLDLRTTMIFTWVETNWKKAPMCQSACSEMHRLLLMTR